MYICYVDESGHGGVKYTADQPVEVVCGVVSDLTKLTKTQREHLARLEELGVPELKAKDAHRGRRDWAGVPPQLRDQAFEEVLGWASERACKFIVSPVDSKRFYEQMEAGSRPATLFEHPWEAGVFNILLALQIHHHSKPKNKGRTLVVCDEQAQLSDHLLDILDGDLSFADSYLGYDLKRAKTPRFDQIIDVPYFARSHQAILIQIADWAAYVMQTHLVLTVFGVAEHYAGEKDKVAGWATRILASSIPSSASCPRGKDELCQFYRSQIRPTGWPP